MSAPVVVVGGGVMGSAAAWQLAARGVPVVLLEQFEAGHDRGASHGSSRIFRLTYDDDLYVALALSALDLWRRLEAQSGYEVLTQTGALDHGATEVTEALGDALRRAGRKVEVFDAKAAGARWPMLRFESPVLFHEDGGRVNADVAVAAFQRAAARRGAVVRHATPVARLESDGDTAIVITEAGEAIRARSVVVAAGAWTDRLLHDFGLPKLKTTQEQPVHFPSRASIEDWPSFLHHPGDDSPLMYGLGSADGVKVGAHAAGPVIDPVNRDRAIDIGALHQVQEYARQWVPGVDSTRPEATTCLYTLTPDHDFIVDRRGPMTVLAGFSGHGFKFAPAIGEVAARLTLDGAPAPTRFAMAR